MTATTTTAAKPSSAKKTAMYAALGAGFLVLPFALPTEAKADDFKISLNLGGPSGYYYQPPVRVVNYHPAPQRIVYVNGPRHTYYHSRPVYRERVVYRDYRGHPGKGHGHGHGRDRWDDRGHRQAWR
ncbi:MAG: hypothetical protein DI585_00435 [Pseudomonas fluorescens]|nr:MAG: hypothetical protein DI585_00435 [Pseudomonas fluorescens]